LLRYAINSTPSKMSDQKIIHNILKDSNLGSLPKKTGIMNGYVKKAIFKPMIVCVGKINLSIPTGRNSQNL
jgi:hypothetical protein